MVDQLVSEARAAAGQAYYVYPPSDDPQGATAFTKIRELEALEGEEAERADEQAAALRQEFAAALVRLGDGYWDREGGKEFASEYYAQALVFDRENAIATERATLPETELETLAEKAETAAFTSEEIARAETQRRDVKANARLGKPSAKGEPTLVAPEAPSDPKGMNDQQKSARDLAK